MASRKTTRQLVIQILAVWASLMTYSCCRTPIPAINEPHYLTKARHFVEPEWCERDLFIASQDAHVVFFWLVGPIAQHSLLAAAIVARLVGYLILAVGWMLLVTNLLRVRWASVLSIWILMLVVAIGNFSGEWIIGGIESKIPAYGFIFASLAVLLKKHWTTAGCLAGLAVCLHPVVGGWNLITLGLVLTAAWLFQKQPIRFRSIISFSVGMIICSLPGLIPALQLVATKSANSKTADFIQVFGRLRHHLDPMDFSPQSWVMYFILAIAFIALLRAHLRRSSELALTPALQDPQIETDGLHTELNRTDLTNTQNIRLMRNYIAATFVVALVGFAIGYGPRPAFEMPYHDIRAALLKFYPFRLFDIALPIGLSVLLVEYSPIYLADKSKIFRRRTWIAISVVMLALLIAPNKDRFPDRLSRSRRADWHEVCQWVKSNTPSDAVVMTPTRGFAFKWYAQRAEFVNYKDCPQDADGIMEWNARLGQIHKWAKQQYGDKQYTAADLKMLRDKYGITHLLADHLGPMAIAPAFENKFFRLYELPE